MASVIRGSDGFDTKNATSYAFSVKLSASQTGISASTWTEVNFDTEEFDSDGLFNTTTHRFQPTVAGWYQFNLSLLLRGSIGRLIVSLAKNGGAGGYRVCDLNGGSFSIGMQAGSYLIHLNGTTDYVSAYTYMGGSGLYVDSSDGTRISGFLVRAD